MSKNVKFEELLEWVDGTLAYESDFMKKIRLYNKIIIFGAGIGGKKTHELMEKNGQDGKLEAFSDNNKYKIGKTYLGKPIIAPETISKDDDILVVVCSTAYDLILAQLLEMGIEEKNIYYFQPVGISLDENMDMVFVRENLRKFEKVYEQLADEKSKKIYRHLLNYRITKKIAYLDGILNCIDREENQYFDEEILGEYNFLQGFVDVGAYVGDTLGCFFEHFPYFEGSYYCLEAGAKMYERLCQKIKEMNYERIYSYKCAVWDESGTLQFDTTTFGDGGGSRVNGVKFAGDVSDTMRQVAGREGECVECDSLDNLLGDKNIDFIKMDIEGSEKRALIGAREIIKKNKPILAVCIYHKQEDFFEIPMTIQSILENEYVFYVRQYRYGQSETVLYAMPKSRKK